MCSFCQSVTLNHSGKGEFKGKSLQCPGNARGLVEKGSVENKGGGGEENHNGVAFQGHEWHRWFAWRDKGVERTMFLLFYKLKKIARLLTSGVQTCSSSSSLPGTYFTSF